LLDPKSNRVYQLKYKDFEDNDGIREYLLSYQKYDEGESINFPTSFFMEIMKGRQSGSIRLNFKDTIINGDISQDKFSFRIPEFAKRGEVQRIFDWLN
ncbi:DUF4292 domain-containing protein, partial [bacterium]|nr:DUF4292 domain-containing protein [bacterium]